MVLWCDAVCWFAAMLARILTELYLPPKRPAELQRKTVASNSLGDRVEIVEADMCSEEGQDQLKAADVVVLHNVFEFFGDVAKVDRCWKTVRGSVSRRGQRLLAVPSLDETLGTMAVSGYSKRCGLL